MTKGPSNRYGNTRGSRGIGKPSEHINFAWAREFDKSTLDYHSLKHKSNFGTSNKNEYSAKAISFANTVDRKNCISFVDKYGNTYKYNKKTNEFAIIRKSGIVKTYFKPDRGINYYLDLKKERKR